MDGEFDERSLDEWMAFSAEDDGSGRQRSSWRHPVVLGAAVIGLLIVIGLIVLRPTGEARSQAEAQRSFLGLPTDFFDAEVTASTTGPCDFFAEQDCVTVSFLLLEGPDEGRTYIQTFSVASTTPSFTVGQKAVLSYRAPNGRVVGITQGPCEFAPDQTCDVIEVVITRGDLFGESVTIQTPAGFESLRTGEDVEVSFDESGEAISVVAADITTQYQFADFQRQGVLVVVFLFFAAAVIALGRWRGLAALAGLGASLLVVLGWLLPAILDGRSAVWVAFVGAAAVAFVAIYVSHGFSLMSTIALLGTIAALGLTTVLSAVTVVAAEFTGLATEEASLLTLFDGIDVRGLLLAGMVLGAAGALDDVTVTQSEAVWQLRRANPRATEKEIRQAGISIGQHHIGSTVNTLLLAYLGASLPLAVLFVLAEQSLGTVLNSEIVAVEVVRTLVGSIGLVAAVPVTTWLAARVATRTPVRDRPVPGTEG